MDAILLVGGEGTRLRPLTYDCPKPMLPVVDRPLVVHAVSWLARHGATRAILSLGYRPDVFADAFPTGEIDGVELVYAVEPELLGTAGAIRFAAVAAGVSERFLVLNGDVLTDLDVGSLLESHDANRAEASLFLTAVEDPSVFGVVPTDSSGRVIEFLEKPAPGTEPTNFINAGVYVFETSVLDGIPAGRPVSIERETFPALVAKGRIYGLRSDAYWIDAGTPGKYLDAQIDILSHRRAAACLPAVPEPSSGLFVAGDATVAGEVGGVMYAGPGAVIEAGASVVDAIIGSGARICAGASVKRSAILEGATVGRGAVVSQSIVGPAAGLGEGCSICLTIVRGGARVPAGCELVDERFPQP